jgi:hypothetical protein
MNYDHTNYVLSDFLPILLAKKIEFIKQVRSATGCSLKEAKDIVDNFCATINSATPTRTSISLKLIELSRRLTNGEDSWAIANEMSVLRTQMERLSNNGW